MRKRLRRFVQWAVFISGPVGPLGKFFHANFWHGNYWHANYWATGA